MTTKKSTKKKTTPRKPTKASPPPPSAAAKSKEAKPAPGVISGGRVVDGARKPARKRDGLSGLDAAAQILAKASEPLNAKAIAEQAIAAGWKTKGATPHATLYSAMIREISTKGKDARFAKAERGRFTAAGKGA